MTAQEPFITSWSKFWGEHLFMGSALPEWALAVAAILVCYLFIVVPNATLYSFLSRKLTADLQARVGPNRVGFGGLSQPVADLLKLLQKSSLEKGSKAEAIWLGLSLMSLFATVAVVPLGTAFLLIDADMAVFFPFLSVLAANFLSQLMGLRQGTVNGFAGAVRVSSQSVVGAFPALISILTAGMLAGGFKWSHFIQSQGAFPWEWALVSSPLAALAFFSYLLGGMISLGVMPFDAPSGDRDIHGGVGSGLSGRRLAIYELCRYYGIFLWVAIGVILFFGGWALPHFVMTQLLDSNSVVTVVVFEAIMIVAKTLSILLATVLVARVTPRLRSDQVSVFIWKVVGPVAVFCYLGTVILKAAGI